MAMAGSSGFPEAAPGSPDMLHRRSARLGRRPKLLAASVLCTLLGCFRLLEEGLALAITSEVEAGAAEERREREAEAKIGREDAETEAEPVEAEPVEPIEAEPIEAEPIEAKPVEAEPVKAKLSSQRTAKPFRRERKPKALRPIESFLAKVVGAAARGAVAAMVAALLSAFVEPIVARIIREQGTFSLTTIIQAMNKVKLTECQEFFIATWPTNMLKFTVFEVINTALSCTSMSGAACGAVSGWLFCTIMLPVTNYRRCKIVQLAALYRAYLPTVLRDIGYGWSRGLVGALLSWSLPSLAASWIGKASCLGIAVAIANVVSSPFNEWRGYWLQKPGKRLSLQQHFKQHFEAEHFLRTTGIGATIMGISLMIGSLVAPIARGLFSLLMAHKVLTLAIFAASFFLHSREG